MKGWSINFAKGCGGGFGDVVWEKENFFCCCCSFFIIIILGVFEEKVFHKSSCPLLRGKWNAPKVNYRFSSLWLKVYYKVYYKVFFSQLQNLVHSMAHELLPFALVLYPAESCLAVQPEPHAIQLDL